MKEYFSFDWDVSEGSEKLNIRVLFKPPGVLHEGHLADAIEKSVVAVTHPDAIAIICSKDEIGGIRDAFKSTTLTQAANRTSKKISLCLCTYDSDGTVSLSDFIRNKRTNLKRVIEKRTKELTDAGLSKLFSVPHVSVSAPPGFTFVKPSGDRSTHFLRTEEALTEIESVQFLSFALLPQIAKRHKVLGSHIDVIYIDSMAIASVAYALREMYCSLYNCPRPRVVSFHSHEGLSDLEFPPYGTSFCIISASSSMRLQALWESHSRCHPLEVVTLLTLKDAGRAAEALHALPPPKSRTVKGENSPGVLRDLRMTGERFSPEELQPKKVLLKAKAHGVAAASNLAEIFSGSSKLTIMSRGPNPNSKVRPLYVNGLSLLETAKFCEFLTKVIEQKVSVSVQAIVYQNDEASRIIAQECARQLQVLTGSENPLEIISQDELDNEGQSLDRRRALLIVAAVVGHGSKLLSISRDLRALHTGARTYLIGVQISESQAQITALRRNLEQSATKAQISVETFSSLSVGAGLVDSYIEEHEFVKTLPEDIKNGPLTARLNVLPGDRTGLNESAFLPTGQNLTENLKLRPDFAFWNFSYKEEQIHVPAVFATAAAILQHARESVSLAPENRLSSDAFQQVVLDPENFARFNDGVIQASLLRAAHRSELDYSSERNASQYMLALLMKILTQHGKPQGEAALEFALALSSGRLRIMTEHLVELKQNIAPALEGNSLLKQTLRVYLRLDNAPDEHAFPADF